MECDGAGTLAQLKANRNAVFDSRRCGRYDEALLEHHAALRLDPEGYEVNAAAARCYIPMRRYQDAITCLEKAAVAIETDFWALGMAIQCYEALGDAAGVESAARRGLERIEKVVAAEPDHGLAIGWGVSSLVALRNVDRAKEWTERAMLLEPDNLNLRYNLGCAMVSLGEATLAIELLEPVFARAQKQNLIWFSTDNSLDPIRADPRLQAMVARAEARLAAV
jgi:adenylate cyclase